METRFRLKRGDFEIEVAGARDFVEAQLTQHLDRWYAMAGEPAPEGGVQAVIRVASDAEEANTESEDTLSESTEMEDFPRVSPDFRPKVNVSIAEFLAMKQAVDPADVVVVAIYYMDRYLQQDTFTAADLQALLAPLPLWACRQADVELEAVMARGHVERLRDGRLTITYKGQNYVREGLAG